jgi:hypothetical protein
MNNQTKLNLVVSSLLFALSLTISSCDTGISVGDDTPPATTEDLSFDSISKLFNWTAPGDDGNSGTATIYFFRFLEDTQVESILGVDSLEGVPFSTIQQVVQDNFNDATQMVNELEPDRAGTPQSLPVIRLDILGTRRFFFAMFTNDEVGNSSGVSNVVEVTTPLRPVQFEDSDEGSCLGDAIGSGNFNGDQDSDTPNRFGPDDLVMGDPCLGRVYIFYGGTGLAQLADDGEVDVSQADVTIIGNPDDLFGASVAGIGNITGDLADELAIGAPGFDGNRGQVLIIRGDRKGLPSIIDLTNGDEPDRVINGENAGDNFGVTITLSRRIFIGAPNAQSGTGKAYEFRGGDIKKNTPASDARAIIVGESPGDMFGFAIADVGQVDDGSSTDTAISSPGAGKVYVFFNIREGLTELSEDKRDVVVLQGDPADGFGFSISGNGDIVGIIEDDDDNKFGADTDTDNDEWDDIIVGAPNSGMNTGSVFLYSGEDINTAKDNGTSPGFVTEFTGLNPGDLFGTSVAVLGDVNPEIGSDKRPEAFILEVTDTNADFVVGAPGISQVYLFFGQEEFPVLVDAGEADLILPLADDPPAPPEFGKLVFNLGNVLTAPLDETDLNEEYMGLNTDFAIGGDGSVRMEF